MVYDPAWIACLIVQVPGNVDAPWEEVANYAKTLRPRYYLLVQAFESVSQNLHDIQREIVKFRLHHLSSLLSRFSVRVSLQHGTRLDEILQVVTDVRSVLELHTRSSTGFRVWKTSSPRLFEFAVTGVMDLVDLKNVSRAASDQILWLYQLLWEENVKWDLRVDDTMKDFWTGHRN